MRIRTIKPEFWTHPVMMRVDDEARLLALALLNYADDEGYFYANPAVVRGALFPLKGSTNIRRAIDELSRIGYLEVIDHPSHGQIGRVVSFVAHQRIDRPKPSIIKELFQSTNDRRTIDERSTLEQGTGNRESIYSDHSENGRDPAPSKDKPQPPPEALELADWFHANRRQGANPPTNWRETWARELDLLIRKDGRLIESVRQILTWGFRDDFWSQQLQSAAGLRKRGKNGLMKFDNLAAAFERDKPKPIRSTLGGSVQCRL